MDVAAKPSAKSVNPLEAGDPDGTRQSAKSKRPHTAMRTALPRPARAVAIGGGASASLATQHEGDSHVG